MKKGSQEKIRDDIVKVQANTKNTYYLDKVKKINEAGMVRDNVIEFELAKNNISPARCQELVEKS